MNATAAAAIRLDGVRKVYPDGTVAVRGLSLEVAAGELVVLVGPSGCGKSTILRMVNRLVEPTGGRIYLGGEDVTDVDPVALRRRMGYVIQHVGLFPHQTVRDNVATVPRLLGWPRARVERPGRGAARPGRARRRPGTPRRYPHELSGGQRQRVGVARALAADPVVLLMDEPFSAVDPIVRARLQEEFLRLQRTVGKTILFVTHDVDEAVRLGDRIAVLSEGGTLEQYDEPASLLAEAGQRLRGRVRRLRPGHQAAGGHARSRRRPGAGAGRRGTGLPVGALDGDPARRARRAAGGRHRPGRRPRAGRLPARHPDAARCILSRRPSDRHQPCAIMTRRS